MLRQARKKLQCWHEYSESIEFIAQAIRGKVYSRGETSVCLGFAHPPYGLFVILRNPFPLHVHEACLSLRLSVSGFRRLQYLGEPGLLLIRRKPSLGMPSEQPFASCHQSAECISHFVPFLFGVRPGWHTHDVTARPILIRLINRADLLHLEVFRQPGCIVYPMYQFKVFSPNGGKRHPTGNTKDCSVCPEGTSQHSPGPTAARRARDPLGMSAPPQEFS